LCFCTAMLPQAMLRQVLLPDSTVQEPFRQAGGRELPISEAFAST
jgi:hypothetical protein